jgi:hypothetical protein
MIDPRRPALSLDHRQRLRVQRAFDQLAVVARNDDIGALFQQRRSVASSCTRFG